MRVFIFFIALIANTFTAFAAEKSIVLSISSIHCELCSTIIKKSLQKADGVQNITISEENKTAKIIFDDQKTNIEQLIKIIANVGYPSIIVEPEERN